LFEQITIADTQLLRIELIWIKKHIVEAGWSNRQSEDISGTQSSRFGVSSQLYLATCSSLSAEMMRWSVPVDWFQAGSGLASNPN